ncbi:FecR family protein [Phytopseudomonas dryadis]|uniref:Iron dicitrate transport regulator FecR n=1 Tax=Phytopseudomonas dryadis TaxID=2487520 RepID=A0A4V2KBE6_9GAMM|nr:MULTISPECIES: FecR family protein [Pseudomonas]TBU85178.1 iron dicitrate transport regulator FecR [Pseudomonas dryadis]TBU98775.1 iron dicitrate transport regulator FecR [Pseudomonas dryadis]TBV13402.1 iron dicitrate transport regulator FecR [Pseudomonas sp. FRB 230]
MSHDPRLQDQPLSAAQQEAWLWLGRLQGQPGDAQQMAFERWLAASPEHVDAFVQMQSLWQLSRPAAQRLADEEAQALQRYLRPARRPRRYWAGALGMAASLVLMVWAGGWQPLHWLDDLGADYVSAPGQVRSLTLDDGSSVVLDADSAIAVRYDAGERHVELRRGAALFSVVPGSVPFAVAVAGGEARVLGTRFEVRKREDGARVTVLQGRVAVRAGPAQTPQILTANQQLGFASGVSEQLRAVDAEALSSWRDGRLSFYRVPLGEVLSELERYYPGRILLLNGELAQRRVSGSFASHDPLTILASLQRVVGFEQHQLFGRLVILR